MSVMRALVTVALLVINFAIGMYLWGMAGYLASHPSPLKAVVGMALYALVSAGAVLIGMTIYRDLTKDKEGTTNAKV